jgi:ribonuclease HII
MKKPLLKFTHTIGIDEVGRGPIAGPVAVGAFTFLMPEAKRLFRGVKESKQLSEVRREAWFGIIAKAQKSGIVDFCVTFQSSEIIDMKGLSYSIKYSLKTSLTTLARRNSIEPAGVKVLLDGGLKAPVEFTNQKTIIKGDEKEMVIALASICAKVMRDRKMNALARKMPAYGFEKHKGYGTRAHYGAIKKYGTVPKIHRRSFLKNF